MAPGLITSWQIDGETMETGTRLYFLGLQNHCRWYLQPCNQRPLLLGGKVMTKPRQHIKKQRHYFANKGPCSQSYGFSRSHIWMCELDYKESWAPKNWCFWTVVLEKTLESPWAARRSNQSIIKEISPECSLEGLMLKLQYFGHLMLGKTEGGRRRGRQRMRWLDGITDSMLRCCSPWGHKESDMTQHLGFLDDSLVKNPAEQETGTQSWVGKIP